jgi:hypothetical protein
MRKTKNTVTWEYIGENLQKKSGDMHHCYSDLHKKDIEKKYVKALFKSVELLDHPFNSLSF